jgi:hypothetical protein
MTLYYGSGVSRVLDPSSTQYLDVIWQQGKPPLDSELTLLQDLATGWRRKIVLRDTVSGWLGNEMNNPTSFITNSTYSNWWRFGRQRTGEVQAVEWAVVNGWLIPVTGTRTGTPPGSPDDVDTYNVIAMDPPPSNSGDSRVDFVFLEVWLAQLAPNPSATNKPSSSAVYKYGNVEGGYSYLADDLIDPELGFETTERVQVQYRIRVAKGLVGLTTNPDGFDPTVVFGQGAASSATNYTFTNMRSTLGDPGLWRAGDGTQNALGTVDGYTYAIPLAGVFRRNSVNWNGDPSQNLNGGFNRNPLAVDRTGIATFSTVPTLSATISSTATMATLVSATNIPLPATPATAVLIQIGDELLTYSAITGTTISGLVRGVNGTRADAHASGSTISVISTRPDGLFSDQIAFTDLLDLRHVVNPNGFDYQALLDTNLDKLLRGTLRSTWKRTGAGPQGPYVVYQDKISQNTAGLGITELDAPDGFRQIFSDAAVIQKIETVIQPTGSVPPATVSNTGYSLSVTATQTVQATSSMFSAGDSFTFPIAALQTSVPGSDTDQIRWVNDSLSSAVTLRIDGQQENVPTSLYTVTGGGAPNTNLVVTLGGGFPATANQIYVTLHVQYGPGRGLARRPNSIQSMTFVSPASELLVNTAGVPSTNFPAKIGWAPLWSRYRGGNTTNALYKRNLPVTATFYADLGSKTAIIAPFRQIIWPTSFITLDGTAANVASSYNPALTPPSPVVTSSTGTANGSTTFADTTAAAFTSGQVGYALQITNGSQPGRYTIVSYTDSGHVVLDRSVPTGSSLSYTVTLAQGLMPTKAADGVTSKWTTTDPLGLFSCSTDFSSTGYLNTKNIYVTLPRSMVPNWGEVDVPILPVNAASTTFSEGINFMFLSGEYASPATGDSNYVSYAASGSLTWAVFTTANFSGSSPFPVATYNTAVSLPGSLTGAGMQFFSDTRNLNRQGLQLPPFYGIARLFAVYEAGDYKLNGSAYNGTDRTPKTGTTATNLLRQNVSTATFWIEIDADGDSTFVLNADCIDITRSTVNPITSFSSGNYVIEASVFGFDRGTFDITQEPRFVLSRSRQTSQAGNTVTRASNIGVSISGPTSVLPGPATPTDTVLVNYSRTPYQGDPWGSQTNYVDIPQYLGPIQTASAYQVDSTELTETALTRPNQKALEVLASVGFVTTMGTGRFSGDVASATSMDFRNVGYENPSQYPPSTSGQARPTTLVGALADDTTEVGTQYLGATERLPLGALWRDKDFRGGSLGNGTFAPLLYLGAHGEASSRSNLTSNTQYEQIEVPLDTASVASGTAGDLVAQVDGEPVSYNLLVNFRVNRGGSLFTMNGAHPGGEVAAEYTSVTAPASHSNVLAGRAMLVRNAVTSVGGNEVSAGDELMLLVLTNVQQLTDNNPHPAFVYIGTNGANEGYSAADLYRIEGHPVLNDNVRLDTNPATITLSRRDS